MAATIMYLDGRLLKLSFKEFKEYHTKCLSDDTMSAEERWIASGGKLPDKVKG